MEMQESNTTQHIDEEIYITWEGLNRPFRKRGIQYYFNIAAISVVIGLILLFFMQYVLIAVMFALIFVGIVIATIPPTPITYTFSHKGITIGDEFFEWEKVKEFYQDVSLNYDIINVVTVMPFPRLLLLMPSDTNLAQVKNELRKHITEIDPPKHGWLDKRADDLVKLINRGEKQ